MEKIEILKGIALEAGEIVKRGYHAHKQIEHKGVVDLVTQYDRETEVFVMQALRQQFPDYTLVGEESHHGSYHYEQAIYIDPIDGTTNFVHGIPHLAISIGVWEAGLPKQAVVYNPILEELYWAEAGRGAHHGTHTLDVSPQNDLQQSLIATGFPYAKVDRGVEYRWVIDSLATLLPDIRDIRRLGAAALDLCYLAEGRTDAFYEIDLKPWDVAAGILILLEAGGEVTNLSGGTFDFDDKGIVASNGKVHRSLLQKLRPL